MVRLIVIASCLVALVPGVARAQTEECAADEACTEPVASQAPASGEEACFPACRPGYLCHAGRCVESCNPPCEAGTTCSAGGMCEPVAGRSAGPTVAAGDSGYAMGAAVTGIVMAALSIGLYSVVAVGTNNGWVDVGLLWGAIGLPFITAPIVGGGALSATGPGVEGLLPLRIGAWIAYGGYFITALVASIHAADHSGDLPGDEVAVTLAILGVATELAFVIDALHTTSQANSVTATVAPTASLVTSPRGVEGAVVGAVGLF